MKDLHIKLYIEFVINHLNDNKIKTITKKGDNSKFPLRLVHSITPFEENKSFLEKVGHVFVKLGGTIS